MDSINNFLMEYLGEFTPRFIPVEDVGTYMFLDCFWILKAILLVVCMIYTLKYVFRVLDFMIHWR